MTNDLAIFTKQLIPLKPAFAEVLGSVMPVERLMRTIVVSCERTPGLLDCDRQSLFNAAMTFAVLGLEVDGVTGQGFLIPFNDRKNNRKVVQPVIGYLGYNTLGARAGMTITGRVVREGDVFEFNESEAVVGHERRLGGECGPNKRRIVGAWARASSHNRPAILRVLSIDELLAVKAKSPRGQQPPWADEEIGFPAMCEKTAKRRLRRDMPLSVYQSAARMEEAHEEQGLHSWIHPDKGVMCDTGEVIAPNYSDVTPTAQQIISPPSLEEEAKMAAENGREVFTKFWKRLTNAERGRLNPLIENLKTIVEGANNGRSS